jgi:hypothetical protein
MNARSEDYAPRARADGLIVRELVDEVIIFDTGRNKAHCLNETAAVVWQHCDGETSVADMAVIVSQETGVVTTTDTIWFALGELSSDYLLEEMLERPKGLSRRQLLKVGVAAAAVPLVSSIAAPSVLASQSVPCTVAPGPCPGPIASGCPSFGIPPSAPCCASSPCCCAAGNPATPCCKTTPSGNLICGRMLGGKCS